MLLCPILCINWWMMKKLRQVSNARVVALFLKAIKASSDYCWLGNAQCVLVLDCQSPIWSKPPKLWRRAAPRAWPLIMQLKPLIVFWNSLWDSGAIARWQAGAQTWTKTWTVPADQRIVRFYWLQNVLMNCVEIELFLGLLKMLKLTHQWGKQCAISNPHTLCYNVAYDTKISI